MNNHIGENIKMKRQDYRMSQAELAKRMNVSQKTISSWEVGRTEPAIGVIEKLSQIFGCKKSELIGEEYLASIGGFGSGKTLQSVLKFEELNPLTETDLMMLKTYKALSDSDQLEILNEVLKRYNRKVS